MCKEMEEIFNWGVEHEKKNTEQERKRAEQAAKLTAFLLENGRVEDCLRAAKDEDYQMQLLKELNIA